MRGTRSAPSLATRLALSAIRLYQRHLSPIKGFSCAYRLATGGAGCSAYGYRAIGRHGLFTGLALLDRRLQRCGEAHRARARAPNPALHYQRGECDCGDLPCDGCGGDCGGPREHPGRRCEPFHRWREKRWLAKAARLQRERLAREQAARMERERRERERQTGER